MPADNLAHQPKKSNKWIFVVVGIVFFLVASWAIICIPQYQVRLLRERVEATQKVDPAQQIQLEKDYVDYANKARTTLAQIVGGLLVLGTIGVALWNAKIAQDNARAAQQNAQAAQQNAETALKNLKLTEETAQKNLEHARDGKITERFSKAVEMLGGEKLEVRLGSIYALERIARDSQPDHWTVMEVLTAFIREKSLKDYGEYLKQNLLLFSSQVSGQQETAKENEQHASATSPPVKLPTFKLASDIQAAITVLGRRNPNWIEQETDRQQLDLRKAVLINARFSFGNFNKARFFETNLAGAEFFQTQLRNARFVNTDLCGTSFSEADIKGAEFYLVRNLYPEFIEGAIRDENTRFGTEFSAELKAYEAKLQKFKDETKQKIEELKKT